jgi:hypothetical protein
MTTPYRFTREAIKEFHALQAYLSERSEQAGGSSLKACKKRSID